MSPDSIGASPTGELPEGIHSLGELLTNRQRKRFKTGDVLCGRYQILGELGQGGMGLVLRCLDQVSGTEVAVKMLPPEVSHDTGEMEEVRENFRLVERLHHPNICAVKTLERDPASGEYLLVMEKAEGVNLRRWRRGEGRPQKAEGRKLEEALPVLRQMAAALDYAHEQKVIHRDIKPANVMVGPDGRVRLLDFGLAAQIHTSFSRVSQVKYGTSGTGPYMAPEQWRGEYQDAATDQYALGVLAYELLAGRLPFESHETSVLKQAVLDHAPSRPEGLTDATWAALKRALVKQREGRHPTCTAFVEALGGTGVEPRRTQRARREEGGRARSPLGLVIGLGLAVVVVLSLGWWGRTTWREKSAAQARQVALATERAARASEIMAQKARDDYERALASADRTLLDASGGEAWIEAKRLSVRADVMTYDPEQCRQLYDQALARLKEALASAPTVMAVAPEQSEEPHPGETRSFDLGGGVTLDVVWIPAGSFMMGSPSNEEGRDTDEGPQHRVTISSGFWMGRYEVTQEQWERLMGGNPSTFKGARNPVENVSWNDADEFCGRLQERLPEDLRGKMARLPTEAEWEYACRALTIGPYAGALDEMGWYDGNGGERTHEVGEKRANAWGLCDMYGNVWEWCWDGKREYTTDAQTDPESSGAGRALRGGGWETVSRRCSSACRLDQDIRYHSHGVGFRVVVR